MSRHAALWILAQAISFMLFACVPLPKDYFAPKRPSALSAPVLELEADCKTLETAHFHISAYGDISSYGIALEEIYLDLMNQTGLYSSFAPQPYKIIIYRNKAEYHEKTGLPDWSGGAAYGNSLLLYACPNWKALAAHEMMHIVFNSFMGTALSPANLWLNEGLAVYMETRISEKSNNEYSQRLKTQILPNPIPFEQMVRFAPQNAAGHMVNRWYAQAWSIVSFMLMRGGSFNFALFLGRLRDGECLDLAISSVYNNWDSLKALENDWQLYINR